MSSRDTIQEIIDRHSLKAQQSGYDRDTCVLAVLKARETLMTISSDVSDDDYVSASLEKLDELFDRYHDPDGQFTSGRGVIGALLDDIRATFDESS